MNPEKERQMENIELMEIEVESEKETLLSRLPRLEDPRQRRAAMRIAWFLALVLVFTLVARGTAGATLARVDVGKPAAGEIVQSVNGTATVQAAGSQPLEAPEGLTPREVLVEPGARVAAGDEVARFDPEEVRDALARAQAALAGLRAKLAGLERLAPHDGTALDAANRALARAREDQGRAAAEGDGAVARAEAALAEAQSRMAAPDAPADAAEALQAAHDALAQAQSAREESLRQAARAIEDAEAALASARMADEQARAQAADTAAQNAAEAATQRLDIADQEKKVAELEALAAAGGALKAPADGVVTEVAGEGAEGAPLLRLAAGGGGFTAEAFVAKDEAEGIQPGDECEVKTGGGSMYYSPTVTGTVTAVSQPDDSGQVKLTLKLPGQDWKQGQQVDVQIVQSRQNHSLCVPLSALHSDNAGNYLLVLEKQTTVLGVEDGVVRVPVTLVAKDGTNAAVEGPVGAGDSVVTGSNKPLEAGDRVRVNERE